MAVTLDAGLGTGKSHNLAPLNLVTGANAAANSVIVAALGSFTPGSAQTHSAPTATGLTFNVGQNSASGSIRVSLWVAVAAAGFGSGGTIQFNASSIGSSDHLFAAMSFLGVDLANPIVAGNGAAATAAAWATGSIAAGLGNAIAAFVFEDGSGTATSTTTAPASEQYDFNDATQTEAATMAYLLSTAASDSIAGNWSASLTHLAAGVALRAASAGGGADPGPSQPVFFNIPSLRGMFFPTPSYDPTAAPVTSTRKRRPFFGIGR